MSPATLEPVGERPLTYEEERGKPMPSSNHSAVQSNLIVQFSRDSRYRSHSELTLELDGRTFTPDLTVYPRQPLNLRRDILRRTDPPLLVVEIFSPSQGYQEVMNKVEAYFAAGVKSCWLVSPHLHLITVCRPDGTEENFSTGTVTDPATGLTADLEAVFS